MGAPAELAAFCTAEHPRLVGAMTLYTGDDLLAEEIAEEALIRVCERWPKVRQMAAPGAWAHRVAMNLAKSRFRRRILERRVAATMRTTEAVDAPHPEDVLAVRAAMRQLGSRQREAVVLRHFLGFSVKEAAEAMRISPGALRSLTHRAGQHLESLLADESAEVDHVV